MSAMASIAAYSFVRSLDRNRSLWEDANGEPHELGPQDVTQMGLMEKLREGLSMEAELPAYSGSTPEATEAPGDTSPATEGLALVGGHADGWAWSYVKDGDKTYVCLDNRQLIDEAVAEHKTPPQYQQVVVPEHILRAVYAMSEATKT